MITIITPSHRWQNLRYLKSNLEKQFYPVNWVILLSEQDYFDKHYYNVFTPSYCPDWIKFILCPKAELLRTKDPCYAKLNCFLNHTDTIDPDAWYGFMCDDNLLGPSVLHDIDYTESDVVIISSKRGNHKIYHDTSTLVASPENMTTNKVDLGQIFVKGKVLLEKRALTDHIFEDYSGADGRFAESIKDKYTVKYDPELFSYFNALEPGRWDLDEILQLI